MIRVLPDAVANKIAAGEVVERPASVVKELLENALDAGARSVRLELEAGGKSRIRVVDDGCGMERDDALLSLERHATSKLHDVESLSAIATLGFRGEALPAIAAVSQMTLETATAAGAGTRLVVRAGKLQKVEAAGLPKGTAITVANLFANIPARKKFLKSEATELGHVATLVTHYALAYPEVQFHLETPHRVLLQAPPVGSHAERLRQVLGEELAAECVEMRATAQWAPEAPEESGAAEAGDVPGLGIFGFASRPEVHKLNRNSIFIFVNRRLVRDRLLQHALSAAYYNLLPNGMFPAALLFLDLPYAEVDVNVHPAKTEVRFRRQGFVHDAVRDTVREAIAQSRPVASFARERYARPSAAAAFQPAWRAPAPLPESPGANPEWGISSDDLPAGFRLTPAPAAPVEQRLPLEPRAVGGARPRARPGAWVAETGTGCGLREVPAAASIEAEALEELRPLGQIADSFIVAVAPGGLWLVDQHVAHERVLFEQLRRQRLEHAVESQRLLMPLIVTLDPGRALAFAELEGELAAAGFEAAPFGRATLAIHAAPAAVPAAQVERLLQEILQAPSPEERGTTLEAVRTRIAATIACHAAIKVNLRLEPEKMEWLLRELAQTEYPMACPHGRPVLLRYSLEEIQRAFKRIS
jgi:DNA mismatch repair protein MutL